MQAKPCHHVSLAQSPLGRIDYCPSCYHVSIHLGAISVRLDPAAGEDLYELLGDALLALRQARVSQGDARTN